MKAKPPNVEPKGWGNNANKIYDEGYKKKKMIRLSTQRHGIDLRRYHMLIKKYKEDWRQYPHTKVLLINLLHPILSNSWRWDEDLDQNEIKQVISQYAEIIL